MSRAFALVVLLAAPAASAQITRETVPGITNFSRVETTIACAGATTAAAVPELRKMGYASIINLRMASESGADLAGEEAAARQEGLKYYHLPFNSASPDPAVVERFIAEVGAPGNQPVFVHCASANRAAALWMIKRMLVDGWTEERASAEASSLGLTSASLKTFARDYVASRRK